jgi:hypothetical protein
MQQSCDMGQAFTSPLKEGVLKISFFRPEKFDGFGRV